MMGGGPNPYYQQQAAWHGPVHGGPRGGPGFGWTKTLNELPRSNSKHRKTPENKTVYAIFLCYPKNKPRKTKNWKPKETIDAELTRICDQLPKKKQWSR